MTPLEINIINIYGKTGKAWLDELPKLVEKTASKLGLYHLKPVSNLSYNYVMSGVQGNAPIILKLGLDRKALAREALALKRFAGRHAINVIAEDEGLLLLERATPGTSLKSYFPNKDGEAIQIVCNVMKKLHSANIPEHHNFPHAKDWLSTLDKKWDLPACYLQKARKLRDHLLRNACPDVLLHGDLHHDNILQNSDGWVVIDPKGVIGEATYEAAAFIRNPISSLINQENVTHIIQNRMTKFASYLDAPLAKIANWCFVQTVLSWIWNIEDGLDTKYFEQLTDIFNTLVISPEE